MTFPVNLRRRLSGNDMHDELSDQQWMAQALAIAKQGAGQNEVPVGAVLVKDNVLLAEAFNQPISTHDPSAHAEILVLRQAAAALKNYRLLDTTLYVTLEPCAMCLGAMLHARVKRLVFGAWDPKSGVIATVDQLTERAWVNHQLQWRGGVMAEACSSLLQNFFKERR